VISTMRRRHPAAARLWLIAVKRATIDSNAHPVSSSRATGKRTSAPAIKPGYGATNLGGHRDDPSVATPLSSLTSALATFRSHRLPSHRSPVPRKRSLGDR
jgi:hypothetical protein